MSPTCFEGKKFTNELFVVLPVGQKLKIPALRALVKDDEELLKISGEKLEQAKREVDEKRMLSTCGTRPNITSVVKDYSATTQQIKKEVRLD